jgi:lysozyme
MLLDRLNRTNLTLYSALCYNIGCGAFAKSSLVKFINGGQTIEKIRIGFLMWIKVGGVVSKGLMRRRLREFNLYAKIK